MAAPQQAASSRSPWFLGVCYEAEAAAAAAVAVEEEEITDIYIIFPFRCSAVAGGNNAKM